MQGPTTEPPTYGDGTGGGAGARAGGFPTTGGGARGARGGAAGGRRVSGRTQEQESEPKEQTKSGTNVLFLKGHCETK